MILGDVIRRWRMWSELSIREVAAMIGVSAATLSRIERGETMDGRTLAKIVTFLLKDGV